MFTGIIEAQGTLMGRREEGTNVHLDEGTFHRGVAGDQSVATTGVPDRGGH